jgi:hypothetical protein
MIGKARVLILAHGAALVFLGLVLGLAAVAEEVAGTHPQTWRAGHNALLLAGVWLLGVAAVFPQLRLTPRQQGALGWSMLTAAYAFATAILVQAVSGVRALGPDGSVAGWVAFVANIVTVGAGLFAGLLTLMGAVAAVKQEPNP